jgi:hypothetical protein
MPYGFGGQRFLTLRGHIMTTLALYSPLVSRDSFGQKIQAGLLAFWTAFVEARRNRAMTLVSFYSAK